MSPEVESLQRTGNAHRLLTLKEAAAELGLPVWTLRRAVWNGELSQVRINRMIRIDRQDLETWLARQKVRGPSP
jgi:excisionase family DNA binding protein